MSFRGALEFRLKTADSGLRLGCILFRLVLGLT